MPWPYSPPIRPLQTPLRLYPTHQGLPLPWLDNDVKRDEVEKLVRELMEGEKGKKLKNKAREWRKLAAEAASPGGSSTLNLNNLINKILFSMGG